MQHLPDLVQLVDVALIAGGKAVEQVAHVVAQARNHLFELLPASFERLAASLRREDFVNEHSCLGHLRDQAAELLECVHILICVHADVTTYLEHSPGRGCSLSLRLLG